MIRKIPAIILSFLLIFSTAVFTSAAEIDNAETSYYSEPGVVAAEYDISGTTLDQDISLPASYSSRALGYTTSVRSQRTSDCWTFGPTATLETFTLKKNSAYPQWHAGEWLSPIHMNYWGSNHNTGYGWFRSTTSGGYPHISLGYLMSWQGTVLEDDYPYTTDSISSFTGYDTEPNVQIAPTSIIYLDATDRYTIKRAVYEYGAVVGNYHENSSYFSSDHRSYYFNKTGLATSSLNGHCISVVGWDDNYSRFNFSNYDTLTGNGAWLCKNSRGESYADGGFFWISYEDTYLFSTKFGYSYAILSTRQMTSSTKMYQNEVYGAVCDFDINITHKGEKTYDSITYANVYDFSDGFTRIENILFETETIGSKYEIYDIPIENGVLSSDETTWTKITETTADYTGYISADANDYMINEGKRAIGIKVYKNSEGSLPLGCDEWLTSGSTNLFIPNTKKGDSYILGASDEAIDLLDYYEANCTFGGKPDTTGSTFAIKIVASQKHNYGCVSKDDEMSVNDVSLIQKSMASITELDQEQTYLADIDYDKDVSIADATILQQMLTGSYPIPNMI